MALAGGSVSAALVGGVTSHMHIQKHEWGAGGESLIMSWRRAGNGHGEALSPSGCVGDPGHLEGKMPKATRSPSKALAERQSPGAGHRGDLGEECEAPRQPPHQTQVPRWVQREHQSPWTGRRSCSRTQDLVGSGQDARKAGGSQAEWAPSRGHGEHPGRRRARAQWAVTCRSLERAVCARWLSSGPLGRARCRQGSDPKPRVLGAGVPARGQEGEAAGSHGGEAQPAEGDRAPAR